MSTPLPAYIEDRIRRPFPHDLFVVPNSTPVIAFGDVYSASIATLGLNPSRVEFQDRKGQEITGSKLRLQTLTSLGVKELITAPDEIIEKVERGCINYFENNPYWKWFSDLENILGGLGVSYKNRTACHLDLVQWATNPVWGKLPKDIKLSLISGDAKFLQNQLERENIKVLLLNGIGVINAVEQAYQFRLKPVSNQITEGSVTTKIMAGVAFKGVVVVGWSTNLQSSFGVRNSLRERLKEEVAFLVKELLKSPL